MPPICSERSVIAAINREAAKGKASPARDNERLFVLLMFV